MSGPSTAALFEQVEALRKRVKELERVTAHIVPAPPLARSLAVSPDLAEEVADAMGRRDVLGAQHAGRK